MSDVFCPKEVDNSRTFGLGHFCIPGTGKIGGLRNRWMGFAPNMGPENSLTTSTTLPPDQNKPGSRVPKEILG